MKTYLLNILSVLLFAGLVTGCKKADNGVDVVAESTMRNVKYGSDPMQSMDVYLPAGRTSANTKVVVFVHGGSWSGGDKTDFDADITAIRPQLGSDYAIFNINYRLAGAGTRHPAQMQDIQSAIDLIVNKAAEYQVDPSRLGLVGASAGAHLALLHAYTNNSGNRIKAVVDLFGPTDLLDLYNNHPVPQASQPTLVNFLGATPATNAALYQLSSPLSHASAQSPATLILHGSIDMIVPISQSIALRNKLQQVNAKVEMKTYANEGHGWAGANLLDTYAKAVTFIKENVR